MMPAHDACPWRALNKYLANEDEWVIVETITNEGATKERKSDLENLYSNLTKTSKALECLQHLTAILCVGNFPKEIIYSKDMHTDVAVRTVQPKLRKMYGSTLKENFLQNILPNINLHYFYYVT